PSNILPALQEVAKNSSAGKEAAPAGRFAIVLPSNAPAAPPAISVTDSGDLALQGDSATIERMRQLVARLDQPTRQELIAPGTFVPSDRGLGWREQQQQQHGTDPNVVISPNTSVQNARLL